MAAKVNSACGKGNHFAQIQIRAPAAGGWRTGSVQLRVKIPNIDRTD